METKQKLALSFLVCLMAFAAARPVGAATARLTLEPSQVEDVAPGATFSINVNIADVSDLYGWQINMTFNPQVLNVENVTEGSFLNQLNETIFIKKIENTDGFLGASAIFNMPYPEHGASGSGLLCTITFAVMSGGSSAIKFNTVGTKLNTVIGIRVPITDFTTTDGAFGNPDSGGLGGFPLEYILVIIVVVVVAVGIAFFFLRRRSKSQLRRAMKQ